jgi:predicted Zn-ribbon and HTH transcriptional regulator
METDPNKLYETTVVHVQRDQAILVVVVSHCYTKGREFESQLSPASSFFCPSTKSARILKKDPTVLKVDWDIRKSQSSET